MHRLTLTILFFTGLCFSSLFAQTPVASDPLIREALKALATEVENCEKDLGAFNASLKAITDALQGGETLCP